MVFHKHSFDRMTKEENEKRDTAIYKHMKSQSTLDEEAEKAKLERVFPGDVGSWHGNLLSC